MSKQIWMGSLFAASVALLGCDRESSVKRETEDLKEAQQQSPEVARDLERQANEAKKEVVRLEEKAALAKQGVTDEVLEERKELNEALKRQEQHVREEVKEAQGAAAVHNTDSERAAQELQRTERVQRMEAEVHTETRAVPGTGKQVEVTREQQQIPVEHNRVIERENTRTGDPAAPAPGVTTDTPRR